MDIESTNTTLLNLMDEKFEAIIIGAGPAGLACALELHESRINYIVLEKSDRIGGQLFIVPNSVRDAFGCYSENGVALQQNVEKQCRDLNIRIALQHEVVSLDVAGRSVKYKGPDQKVHEVSAETLLVTGGSRRRRISFAGDNEFADDIHYWIEGIEDDLVGKKIVIIGGGDNALLDALELAEQCPAIHIIHRTETFKARPDVVELAKNHSNIQLILRHQLVQACGETHLNKVRIKSLIDGSKKDIDADVIVVRAGYEPETSLLAGKVKFDHAGYIVVDKENQTSEHGIFAAGDVCSPGYARIAAATAGGFTAALAMRQQIYARAI